VAKLLARPVGQPSCLPPNVADLAMHLYRKSSVSLAGMPSGPGQGALGQPFRCSSMLLWCGSIPLWHGNVARNATSVPCVQIALFIGAVAAATNEKTMSTCFRLFQCYSPMQIDGFTRLVLPGVALRKTEERFQE
jgi:hypothetical protein